MKLLSVAIGIVATEVLAHENRVDNAYIPWDCYYESQDDEGHY